MPLRARVDYSCPDHVVFALRRVYKTKQCALDDYAQQVQELRLEVGDLQRAIEEAYNKYRVAKNKNWHLIEEIRMCLDELKEGCRDLFQLAYQKMEYQDESNLVPELFPYSEGSIDQPTQSL